MGSRAWTYARCFTSGESWASPLNAREWVNNVRYGAVTLRNRWTCSGERDRRSLRERLPSNQLGAVGASELREHVAHVALDRSLGEHKLGRDLAVAHRLDDQVVDLALTR